MKPWARSRRPLRVTRVWIFPFWLKRETASCSVSTITTLPSRPERWPRSPGLTATCCNSSREGSGAAGDARRGVVQCGHRNESAAAGPVALEELDGAQPGCWLATMMYCRDSAQGRLDRHGGRRFRLDHVGDQADDAFQQPVFRGRSRPFDGAGRPGVLHDGPDAALVPLEIVFHPLQGGMLGPHAAAIELQALDLFHEAPRAFDFSSSRPRVSAIRPFRASICALTASIRDWARLSRS